MCGEKAIENWYLISGKAIQEQSMLIQHTFNYIRSC